MTTATLLTLLVVPVFYTLFDDARDAVVAALRRGRRPAAAPGSYRLIGLYRRGLYGGSWASINRKL